LSSSPDLIILGASARAAAQSAILAGYTPWCADLFADRDLAAIAATMKCPPGKYPRGLLSLVRKHAPPDALILLTGAMENYPRLIGALQSIRPTLHASAGDIQALRQWNPTEDQPRAIEGIRWPETHHLPEMEAAAFFVEEHLEQRDIRWIIKPVKSASGVNVEPVVDIESIYWPSRVQQFIAGLSLGVVWRSHHGACELLGVTKQILGDEHFGVTGLRYAGSIGPWPVTPAQQFALVRLGQWLTDRFNLQGLWGSDVIVDEAGDLWPIEFNPRYTASVEVLEKACSFAALNPSSQPAPATRIHGKAYVFAKYDARVPDLYESFTCEQIADVPNAGSEVRAHQPICTIFADGDDVNSCLTGLHALARQVYTRLQ